MKNLFIILVAVSLLSCKKEIDESFFEEFQEQTVFAGNNYCGTCERQTIKYFSGNVFKADVMLDTSLIVPGEGSYQNKLLGFCEDNIHQNSVRVSYHTVEGDSLEFKTYVYNSGERIQSENKFITRISKERILEMLDQEASIPVTITVLEQNYVVKFGDIQEIYVNRTCILPIDGQKYLANHYYGGTPLAPKDMTIWIRFDPIMKS
jgi:hypothetical protein